jgi:hypothetical protein
MLSIQLHVTCSLAGIDLKLLNELVAFLDTFTEASSDLEADKTPTLHLALPWLHKLKNHCHPASNDSVTMASIKKNTLKLLDEKFK